MSEEFHSPEGYVEFVSSLVSSFSMENFHTKLNTMALGLAGESGEIGEIVARPLMNSHNLADELGDICWYVAFACKHVVNIDFGLLYNTNDDYWQSAAVNPNVSAHDLYLDLSASCGKVADRVKKILFHGKAYNFLVRSQIIEGLRRIMILVDVMACVFCQMTVKGLIVKNVNKLSKRYSELKFNVEEALAKEQTN